MVGHPWHQRCPARHPWLWGRVELFIHCLGWTRPRHCPGNNGYLLWPQTVLTNQETLIRHLWWLHRWDENIFIKQKTITIIPQYQSIILFWSGCQEGAQQGLALVTCVSAAHPHQDPIIDHTKPGHLAATLTQRTESSPRLGRNYVFI